MQRSGSQKALLVLSILNIIGAVLALLGGLGLMMGGAFIGAVNSSDAAQALAGSGVSQGELGILTSVAGFVVILAGVVELVMGILGVRAANDNQKIMPVWVLAIISLVLNAIGLVSSFVSGTIGTQGASYIVSLILAVLMMWICNNIKREAGR